MEDLFAIKAKIRVYKGYETNQNSFWSHFVRAKCGERRIEQGREKKEEEEEEEEVGEDQSKVCFHLEIMGILDS